MIVPTLQMRKLRQSEVYQQVTELASYQSGNLGPGNLAPAIVLSQDILLKKYLFDCTQSLLQHVRFSSLTRYQTQTLCIGNMES